MTLCLRADSESDAYLILKGDAMAVDVRDAAKQLSPKCPAQRAVLVAIDASSRDFMAPTPPVDHVRELTGKGWNELRAKHPPNLLVLANWKMSVWACWMRFRAKCGVRRLANETPDLRHSIYL